MGRTRMGHRVWIRVPDPLLATIDAGADRDGRTRSDWIRRACERAAREMTMTTEYAWISGNDTDGYVSARIPGPDVPWDQSWHDESRDDLGIPVGDAIPDGWVRMTLELDGAAIYRRPR